MTIPGITNSMPVGDLSASKPRNVQQAATQFEAMLISQMLKATREAGEDGWLGTGDDQAGSTMTDMAEEQLSQSLAQNGGLGLAKMIVKQLGPKAGA